MASFILSTGNVISTTYDQNTQEIQVNTGNTFIMKDKYIDTSTLSTTQRIVQIPSTNKTYHLRFTLNRDKINNFTPPVTYAFYLVDLSDSNYNPNGLDAFDKYWFSFVNDLPVAVVNVGATFSATDVTITQISIPEQYGYELFNEGITRYRSSDIEFIDPYTGIILIDRITSTKYRLYIDGGVINLEVV